MVGMTPVRPEYVVATEADVPAAGSGYRWRFLLIEDTQTLCHCSMDSSGSFVWVAFA